MNISVDGGGLPIRNKSFGNAIFSANILKAIQLYEKNNNYFIYTLHSLQKIEKAKHMIYQYLKPLKGWMRLRVSMQEFINPKTIFLALNQSLPYYASGKIIAFSHGLSFYLEKSLYKDEYDKFNSQVNEYMKRSNTVIVSSKRVEDELKDYFPAAKNIVTIPFGVPFDFLTTKKLKRKSYMLFVGSNHEVKRISLVIKVFNKLIQEKEFSHFNLYLCGKFEQSEFSNTKIKVFNDLNRDSIKKLYQEAAVYLAPSSYESFNLPVLEALSQNCPVVGMESAIIPEMIEFVDIANTEDSFYDTLKSVLKGKHKQVSREKVLSIFSWKKYITKLVALYNK